jgi:hypothetical protein
MSESAIIKELIDFIKVVPASTGVCMCGIEITKHVYEDHAPLDQFEYSATYFTEKYKSYLESPQDVCQDPQSNDKEAL